MSDAFPITIPPMKLPAYLAAMLVLAGVAVGCVEQPAPPEDCDASVVERKASLSADRLDPEALDVCKGQKITIQITTQRGGDLHLHGYEDEAPEVAVEPGDTATFMFTAARAGQFVIELHTASEGEIEVGLLTVHEH